MSDKVKVITKEAGKPAQICEMEDSYKAIKDFLGGAIEYHDHPTLGVQFIVNRDAQSWDNTATVYVGGSQEVLGGNFIVAKHGEEGEIVSFDDKEAQDVLKDIQGRELNHTDTNIAMAKYDLRQAKRFSQGLEKGIEMD